MPGMDHIIQRMFALNGGSGSVTINLYRPRRFMTWVTVTVLDPTITFDRDNAVVADIFRVDGVKLPWQLSGGDHFGPAGDDANARPGSHWTFSGQVIEYRLRAFGPDVNAMAEAVVLAFD